MRPTQPAMNVRTLRPFLALTFGLSWGVMSLAVVFADQVEAIFGEMGYTNPVFILAVYAPGIAGVALVARHYGLKGLRRFLRRLTLWRMAPVWWAVLVVGMPAVFYAGAALKGTLSDPFPFSPWYEVLPALAIALFIGPIEELGWRGVALPLLQRRFAPLWAGLILGAIVAVWHLPAFFLSGTKQSSWAILPFLLGVVAISVILTALFNAAGGSILIAVLFHFQMKGPHGLTPSPGTWPCSSSPHSSCWRTARRCSAAPTRRPRSSVPVTRTRPKCPGRRRPTVIRRLM